MGWSFLDLTGLSRFFGRLPEKLVTTDTTQTISGTKSFSSTILGSVSGSAASAAKDGAGNVIADTYETKADAATHLSKSDAAGTYLSKTDAASTCVQTGAVDQTVAGTKTFSEPIVGSVTGSSGSCTGNAATATKLATARSLWGNNFDGSAAITGTITGTPSIEFMPAATSNNGGFLDFHYNHSTADYTSRIIESASGTLSINNVTITTGKVVTATTFNGALKGNVTGNCSGSSGSCTGNAATATKLATARTIALSGAATGTATGFDGSGNITIPVTALSGSAITSAVTIYDLVPDGAANHRNFYRGKDITAAFNNGTVSANIENGTFRDIFPGDYITKQITVPQILKADGTTEYIAQTTYTVKFIIADLDVWLSRGDTATTAHHMAIVPERVVFNSCMNETNVTDGGYLSSFMNTHVMPAFATGLQNAFGEDHILQFRFLDTKAVNNNLKSGGVVNYTGATYWGGHEWTSHYCHLMLETMVYGAPITASCAADEIMGGVQFAAFRLNSNLMYNRQNYWLSDVVSSAPFANVDGNGLASASPASYVRGVRPFALLV